MVGASETKPFKNFVPDCARFILQREQKEMPADMIAEHAIDRGLYKSNGQGRVGQITSLLGTLHSEVTRAQPHKSPSEQVFYRTEKKPHPRTQRMVYYFGLTEWKRAAIGRGVRGAGSPVPSDLKVAVQLNSELQAALNVLVAADVVRSEADGLLWLAAEGRKARADYLGELRKVLELLRNVRDGVGLTVESDKRRSEPALAINDAASSHPESGPPVQQPPLEARRERSFGGFRRKVVKYGSVETTVVAPDGTQFSEATMGAAARHLTALYPGATQCAAYTARIDSGKTANARLYIKRDIAHGLLPAGAVLFGDE